MFQSAPDREAGRCRHAAASIPALQGFNPRPTVRPGDARLQHAAWLFANCFNPRPTVRPGDAWPPSATYPPAPSFNPRPTVRPGDASAQAIERVATVVSIRARP